MPGPRAPISTTWTTRAYLDFLSGYSVFNIGRNHPVVKQAIRDVLDLDLPNMVQMDCSLLSGLLAEALTKRTAAASRRGFLLQLRHGSRSRARSNLRAPRPDAPRVLSLESAFHGLSLGSLSVMGCENFHRGLRAAHAGMRCAYRRSMTSTRLERELRSAMSPRSSSSRCRARA